LTFCAEAFSDRGLELPRPVAVSAYAVFRVSAENVSPTERVALIARLDTRLTKADWAASYSQKLVTA
jgi:hypothetical protein